MVYVVSGKVPRTEVVIATLISSNLFVVLFSLC